MVLRFLVNSEILISITPSVEGSRGNVVLILVDRTAIGNLNSRRVLGYLFSKERIEFHSAVVVACATNRPDKSKEEERFNRFI
jgi:hypothetical protein